MAKAAAVIAVEAVGAQGGAGERAVAALLVRCDIVRIIKPYFGYSLLVSSMLYFGNVGLR